MWGVTTPIEAIAKIEEQKMEAMAKMKADGVFEPRNLEEQAQILIGKDIYEKLIKGYTENNGGESVLNFLRLLLNVFQYVSYLIIIISMINIRGFR